MDIDKIIHLAADAGKIILENGGETYRVEETIIRICNAFGVRDADSFVTPTGIIISVTYKYGQTISLVKRIKVRRVDLEKISRVNDLSRNIKVKGLTAEDFKEELKKIQKLEPYSNRTNIFFACLVTSFFTLLFGGDFKDFLVSFVIGGIIKSISLFLSKINLNDFFVNVLGGGIAAFLALYAVHLSLAGHIDKIIIGSIMLLVPGLAITNAIRDTIAGDLVAGISRAVEAFLIAVAIAVGTGVVMKLWLVYMGGFAV